MRPKAFRLNSRFALNTDAGNVKSRLQQNLRTRLYMHHSTVSHRMMSSVIWLRPLRLRGCWLRPDRRMDGFRYLTT